MSAHIVILAPNWLGDAVMALPAIRDVRAGAPLASIAVAARPAVAPLFQLVSGVDRVLSTDGGIGLGRGRFDAALLLPNSFHAALVAFRAGIPERWGYRADLRSPLLTRAVARPARGHQIDYYQHLTQALGFSRGEARPRLDMTPGMRQRGAEALTAAGWNGRDPLVGFAPGAAYGGAKRWPPEYFAELASALAADGVVTVMVGSAADAKTGTRIQAALGAGVQVLNVIGQTDLGTLCGVLAACRTLVTNDSGAMHVAAALGVPVTAVFGPTREHETAPRNPLWHSSDTALAPLWHSSGTPLAPLGGVPEQAHAILVNDVWCRPCMQRECPLDHRCMRGVTPARVLDSARRVL
jgi:heptosyltransferase II